MDNKKLCILCLEDVEDDALLIRKQLQGEGWEIQFDHVATEKEYIIKLKSDTYDVILSDYNLPAFNGIAALLHAKKICPAVPFICITGSIGEDLAVELMRLGASDYILKDKLQKLPVAVERVLKEAEVQKAQINAENELRKLSRAIEQSPVSVIITNKEGDIEYINPKFTSLTGYGRDEVIGKNPRFLKSESTSQEEYKTLWKTILSGGEWHGEFKNKKKNGDNYFELASISPIFNDSGKITHYIAVKEDITDRKRGENDLRKFMKGIENSSDAIFITDLNGTIEFINPAFEKIYGFPESEALGKTPRILKSGLISSESYKQFWDALLAGNPVKGELKNKTSDRRIIDIEASNNPILDEKGTIVGFISINRDITERKQAEEALKKSEEKYRKIFENVQDVFYQTDINGLIIDISPSIYGLSGYLPEELVGKPITLLYENAESRNLLLTSIGEKGKVWDFEIKAKTKSGAVKYLSLNTHKLFDSFGDQIGIEGSARDITERKQAENDLILSKEKAEESNRLKTAFMNTISHEVRTPLNGILGFSEFVLQPDIPEEEKKYYLEVLNSSSERLLSTITNYMDISLIASGNMIVKAIPVDLALLLDEIYNKFHSKCKAKNLEFIKQIPSKTNNNSLLCDPSLLEKTISHLVDNAIKFTITGSVTLGFTSNENEFELFVKDTGAGISIESQSTVFEFFRQEDVANTRGYEGSGLGLSIAKGLLELMGGRIRVESGKGKGSAFYLTFPKVNGQSLEIKTPDKTESKKNASESSVILIAEDDESNSSLLITIFKKASINYLLAFNGKEAVELCRTHPEISLVIMDIKMPVMDGLEATRKIKELRKDLPIIGVTAFAMIGDKEKALEAGCDDCLTKPVKSDFLLSIISKHLWIDKL
jgi:PAS domain S-box-containing protein